MGPGTPSINQVKQMLGLQPEDLGSILQTDNYDKLFGKVTDVGISPSRMAIQTRG